jgi:PilZ domain-containing protein
MAMKKATPKVGRRGRERRGSERADARLSMRVEAGAAGAGRIVTESQNISASGVYCHVSHYLAPLSKVQLTIVLPRTPGATALGQELVKCDAIVVRCDQRGGEKSETPYELACMFTTLHPDLRERIEQFVTWRNLQALRAALAATSGTGQSSRSTRGSRPAASTGTVSNKTSVLRRSPPRALAAKKSPPSPSGARSGAPKRAAKKAAKRSTGRARG